jgi:type IV pilus assembly protein PilN
MIHVNLLGEKKDRSGAYAIHILTLGGSLLLVIVCCFMMYSGLSEDVQALTQSKQSLETKAQKLRAETKKVEELEDKKKLLGEKLTTIARLKSNKKGPVKVLNDVTVSLPERIWLESVKEKNGYVEINGVSLDNQTVSEFIYRLEQSPYFDQVKLIFSQLYLKDNVNLKQFSLSARLANSLTASKPQPTAEVANSDKVKPKAGA